MTWSKIAESEKHKHFRRVDAPGNKVLEFLVQRENKELSVLLILTPEAYQALYTHFEKHSEFGCSKKLGVLMTNNGYKCALTVQEATEKDVLGRFLDEILAFESGVSEILGEVKTFARFLDVKAAHQDLLQHFELEGYEAALVLAKKIYEEGIRDVFVVIAKACIEKSQIDQALEVFKQIPERDHRAHFEAAKLLLTLNNDSLALEYLFKAGNDPVVQEIRDRVFWLCANKAAGIESEEVIIRGIRLNDPKTMIAITKKIKDLQVETEGYTAEQIRLETSLKEIQSKFNVFLQSKT